MGICKHSKCYICNKNYSNTKIIPCNHWAFCKECVYDKITKCPICKENVESYKILKLTPTTNPTDDSANDLSIEVLTNTQKSINN